MPAYCIHDDLVSAAGGQRRLIELADIDGDGAITSDGDRAFIDQAIADTQAWIDSYVKTRHRVPLDPVPAHIRTICAEEAIYRMLKKKGAANGDVRDDHEERERYLERVSRGVVSLGVDPDPASSSAVRARVGQRDGGVDGVLTRDSLKGMW